MTPVPSEMRDYLLAPSLKPLWQQLRDRLQRNGQAVRGSVTTSVDDDGADRLSGLLGRPVTAGQASVRLVDLDAALRSSAAGRGLVAVVTDLTGAPLRNLPAERDAALAGRQRLWTHLEQELARHGLSGQDWVAPWADWQRRAGVLTRLSFVAATRTVTIAVQVMARVLGDGRPPTGLAELASEITGDAHGLDDGVPAAALALRAIACALGATPAASAAERRALWQRVGVGTDEVSGTVITWALRPPGRDRWSAMMRERADLGLISHLTVHELRRAGELTAPGEVVHACENPQVLQRLAAAAVPRPVVCLSGNPAAAGVALIERTPVRYHGDFDWAGIAIARRVIGRGAAPWRFGRADYEEALHRLPADSRLGLSGRAEATPWDEALRTSMMAADVAVHEEAIVEILLADLSG